MARLFFYIHERFKGSREGMGSRDDWNQRLSVDVIRCGAPSNKQHISAFEVPVLPTEGT
jgi:hypothetical protein